MIKTKKLAFSAACVFALAIGFSASVLGWGDANPGDQCAFECTMQYLSCVENQVGTPQQCQQFYANCVNNCGHF